MRDILSRTRLRVLAASAVMVLCWAALPGNLIASNLDPSCAVVEIHEIGYDQLTSLQAAEGVEWWVELGGELLICGGDTAIASIAGDHPLLATHPSLDPDHLRIARGFHQSQLAGLELEVIAQSGGVALVASEHAERFSDGEDRGTEAAGHGVLRPVVPNSVVVREAANKRPRRRATFAPEVHGLVDMVDGNRWFADVETLASHNRYTHNPGIDDAREWLVAELESIGGLVVTTSSFLVGSTTAYNVIATLTGHTRPDEWYIVGAHYDSTSPTPQVAAPGAEDNGSGCAGVLEMARIFAAYPPEATTIFICYSAEELGLLGSYEHVDDLTASGDLDKVQVMLNLDMIGYTSDSDLDCMLETEPFASFLLDLFEDAALQFSSLRIVTDESACCSDHKPYLQAGVPALLTIENDWFQYPYYHQIDDLPEHLTIAMGREILKMNVAAVAQLVGSTEPPLFADGFESGDTKTWSSTVP